MADKEATLLIRIKKAGGEVLDDIKESFTGLGAVATAVFAAIGAAIVYSIKQYHEQEQAVNSLNQSLVQQGVFTADLSEEYQKLANQLEKNTKFRDEEIVQAEAIMQNYLGQTKISKELLSATLDLATAKKMDLASAAEMVAKSVGTSTNALARQGLKMSENLDTTNRLARVTEFLNDKFHGQAEAATKGLGGIAQLQKHLDNFAKAMGEQLAPTLEIIVESLNEFGQSMSKNTSIIDLIVSGFKILTKAAIISFAEIKVFGDGLGAMFATIGASIEQLAHGNVRRAFEIFKEGDKAAAEDSIKTRNDAAEILNKIDDASVERHKANNIAKLQSDSDANLASVAARAAQVELDKELDLSVDEYKKQQKESLEMGLRDLGLKYQMEELNKRIANEKNIDAQKALIAQKGEIRHKAMIEGERQRELQLATFKMQQAQLVGNHSSDLANNLVTLTRGKNRELIIAQKALAIGMIIINGEIARYRALAELGPIAGAVASAIILANEIVSIALVSGVTLADGGIVKARTGGVPAIIGEGGKDEAVIPLDSPEAQERLGGGGGVTINVYGGLLGDRASAREFIISVDKELLELRRSKQSLSFDEGLV